MNTNLAGSAALDELGRKQNRRTLWGKIGIGLFFVAAAIRLLVAFFGPEELRSCDDPKIQSAVTDMINDAIKRAGGQGSVTSVADFKTISSTEGKFTVCTGRVTMNDATSGTVRYRVVPKKVQIEALD